MNEYSRFGAAFALLNRSAHAYFASRLAPFGIRPAHQGYLLVILPNEEINQERIANRHQVDKANAARAVALLEQLGYVSRRKDPMDRRNWLVSLTETGMEVRAAVESMMREWVEVLSNSVDAGTWRTMLTGVESMARAAAEYASDPGPDRS
ncbi:MAG: MarR family winged helix-turn-helix transcriptional regulator [Spirochaetota bacterium]